MALKKFNRISTAPKLNLKESTTHTRETIQRIIETLHKAAGSLGDNVSDIWDIKVNDDLSLSIKGRVRLVSEDDEIEQELLDEFVENGRLTVKIKSIDEGGLQLHDIKLTSLEGLPETINGYFHVFDISGLVDFKGGPKHVAQSMAVNVCPNLSSLEGLPLEIGGDLTLQNLPIKSFKKSTPTKLVSANNTAKLIINKCPIADLRNINKYFPVINGIIRFHDTPIKSGILSLLEIKGLKRVEVEQTGSSAFADAVKILNKYLEKPNPKQFMVDCSEELEQAGFETFADL